jgi:hypothetical protein
VIRNFVDFVFLGLTGGFGIYGLLHDFRVRGKVTKAGRIAIIGFCLGLLLSMIGFGLRVWDERKAELTATERLLQQSQRHEELLRKSLGLHYSLATSEFVVQYIIQNVTSRRPDLVEWFKKVRAENTADVVTNGQTHISDVRRHPDCPVYIPKLVLVATDSGINLKEDFIPNLFKGHSSGLCSVYLRPEDLLSAEAGYEISSDYVYLNTRYHTRLHDNTSNINSIVDFDRGASLGIAFPEPSRYRGYILDSIRFSHPNGKSVEFDARIPVPEIGDFLTVSNVIDHAPMSEKKE